MYAVRGIYLALLTYLVALLFLLGFPKGVGLVATGVAILVAPIVMGWRIMIRWNREAPLVVAEHPVRFLRKVRDIRYAGYVVQAIALGFLVYYLAGQPGAPSLLAQAPLEVAFVYFFVIEVVLLQVTLNFWRPEPLVCLRACLSSEEDAERTQVETWLDDALDYFNQLKTRGFALGVKEDVSLDALLFGSSSRRKYAYFLLRDVDTQDYHAFVNDVSEVARKPVGEIVGRVGVLEKIRKNQWTILSTIVPVLLVLVTNPSMLQAVANPIINNWSNLLKSVH